jgi:hypothetical protein
MRKKVGQVAASDCKSSTQQVGPERLRLIIVPGFAMCLPSVLDAADQRILTRLAEVGFPIFFDWPEWHTLPLATLKKRVRHRLGRLLWASAECFARPNALGYPSLSQSSAQSAMAHLVVERTEHADAADRKHRRVVANTRLPL